MCQSTFLIFKLAFARLLVAIPIEPLALGIGGGAALLGSKALEKNVMAGYTIVCV